MPAISSSRSEPEHVRILDGLRFLALAFITIRDQIVGRLLLARLDMGR
jgi:hypothetical protein